MFSKTRRYLALFFPWFPTDRLSRTAPWPPEKPLVLVEQQRGARRLAAMDARAAMLGLYIGMPLADARAAVPDLHPIPHDPQADASCLDRLAEDCGRYTPLVALDAPDGLLLDISGCTHLYGGEDGFMRHVRTRMEQGGFSLRCAITGTAESARALARHAPSTTIAAPLSAQDEREAVARLPVAALDLDDDATTALIRAGLKQIGDLSAQPMAHLAARFGMDAATALRRLRGEETSPLAPRRTLPPVITERRFAEPLISAPHALKILGELVTESARILEQRGEGGRQFRATFFRSDGMTRSIAIETGHPTRDPKLVIRLFAERLDVLRDPLDPGFGFDMMRMAIPRLERMTASQLHLEGGAAPDGALAELADRLATRLGRGHVRRYRPADTHIPEQAQLEWPASDAPPLMAWQPPAGDPPTRPLYLFDPPERVEVMAEVPDGPPHRFRWRRVMHVVRRHEGPERIAAQWWRRADNAGLTRDYYRIEDVTGRRYWLFRHGLYDEKSAPHWYLHGLFA